MIKVWLDALARYFVAPFVSEWYEIYHPSIPTEPYDAKFISCASAERFLEFVFDSEPAKVDSTYRNFIGDCKIRKVSK